MWRTIVGGDTGCIVNGGPRPSLAAYVRRMTLAKMRKTAAMSFDLMMSSREAFGPERPLRARNVMTAE